MFPNVLSGACVLVICLLGMGVRAADNSAEQKKALADIRAALADRAHGEVEAKLTRAKALKGDTAYDDEVARLELLAEYVRGFWDSVDKGARAALAAGEIMVDGKPLAMVEYERDRLVIRHEGQNKRYTQESLPPKLALVLAQQHLKPELANNKVYFGAFLATDGKGDRTLARREWEAAAKGGVDVKPLIPELESARAPASIKLPELTPPLQAALNPAQWQLRVKKGNRVEREPLGKQAALSAEGRLVVEATGRDEPSLIHKTRLAGDFQCRVYLKDVAAKQQFGLFPAVASETAVLVDLPDGTVKVELARIKGAFSCRINDEEVKLGDLDKGAGKVAGFVGVSLVEGRAITVGSFELVVR